MAGTRHRRTVLKFDRVDPQAVRLLRDRLGRAELHQLASLTDRALMETVLAAAVSEELDIRPEDVVGRSIGCGIVRRRTKRR